MEIIKLYHYTTINTLALILSSKQIRFNRLDKVNDPTEGLTKDFDDFSKYLFVSCWTNNGDENLAMWNMYTPEMRGVRIEIELPIFNSYTIDNRNDYLVPEKDIVDEEKCIFTSGGENRPIKMQYTNDDSQLIPEIRTNIGLKTSLLGRYKRDIWSIEEEYRYIIEIIPIDPKIKSDYFPDKYEYLLTKKTPPSIDSYYIEINDKSFDNMKILLGPKLKFGDREIIESLVEKYNKKAAISASKINGLIR